MADIETWNLICTSLGKSRNSKLLDLDIRKIPCNDFLNIDLLSQRYSEGRFGFSVKSDIFDTEGGDYKSFCDRIGYRFKLASRLVWIDTSRVS